MRETPVYLFTGFLEGGKTKFINDTIAQGQFDDGEKTLLLICEEGIEEYDVEALAENTNGFNCSDITNLLDRIEEISIIRGIKTGEKYIADEDFATALTEIHSSVQADDIVKLREWREGNDQ